MSGTQNESSAANKVVEPTTVTRYVYKYHNDSINTLNWLVVGLALLVALLGFYIFVQIVNEPKPLHFKLDQNLQLITPVPLDKEGITTAALLNWVNEFVVKAFSYNYSNMQKQQAKLADYFSDTALKAYSDLLATDPDFSSVAKNQFVVSIVPKSAPEILVGKAYKDRYAWQIRTNVFIYFSNALYKASQDAQFDFLVWRVPETESPLGITVVTFTHETIARTGVQGTATNVPKIGF